jgi:hypothetical protein
LQKLRANAELELSRMDQSVTKDLAGTGILERALDGWRGLSETNNPDLFAATACARELLSMNDYSVGNAPVGLGFVPTFNAWHHRTFWGSVALISVPLVVSLDALNTLEMARQHHLSQDETLDSPLPDTIRTAIIAGGDFIGGRAEWLSSQWGDFLKTSLSCDGPNFRWSRMGYYSAMTQRCWILLHEFGHAFLDHRPTRGHAAFEQEFAADKFATEVLSCADDDIRERHALMPCEIAIPTLFEFLEVAEGRSPEKSDTHPSMSERRQRQMEMKPNWEFEGTLKEALYGTIQGR